MAGALWAAETAEVKENYAQRARELKQQSEAANPKEKKASRRSAKTKRRSEASSGQSPGQLFNTSLPGAPDSSADVDDIIHQRAE
jgi:hypothetical protein